MDEKRCKEVLDALGHQLENGRKLSLPVNFLDGSVSATLLIKDLMDEIKHVRETLGKEVEPLIKVAVATDTAYDGSSLAFELGVFAESIFCRLLENDWYEGDHNGEDSKAYFETETDLLKVIQIAECMNAGKPIAITTLQCYPIVQMHEWTHLTKEVVLSVREENDWLKLDLAPENQEK